MGKVLGVDMIVVGSVSELGTKQRDVGGGLGIFDAGVSKKTARAAVDIRLVNTTTGEIIAAETEEGTASSLGLGVRYDDINFSDHSAWDDTDLGQAAREAIDGCVELITEQMDAIPWSGRILKVNTDGTVLMKPGSEGSVTTGMELDVYQAGEEIKDPDTGLSGNAQFWIGETYYQKRDFEKAILEYEQVIAHMRTAAERDLAALAAEKGSASFESMIVEGVPFVEIIKIANDLDSDLIVIGSRGHSGLTELFFGGTAEKVLRGGRRPVLCIP